MSKGHRTKREIGARNTQNEFAQILGKAPDMAIIFGRWPALFLLLYTVSMARPTRFILKLGTVGAFLAIAYGVWKHHD